MNFYGYSPAKSLFGLFLSKSLATVKPKSQKGVGFFADLS
jgi:hypothetical protein